MAKAPTTTETAQAETVAPRETNIMSAKLTVKQLGDPKKAAAQFDEEGKVNQILLGYIYGRADGVKRGKNPDQMSTHTYLTGIFEAEPADKSRPISRSGKCILNDSIQNPIEEMFDVSDDKTGAVVKESKQRVEALDFKFAVYVIRSTAALGYSWAFKPVVNVEQADPLAALRATTPENVKQLAAPAAQAQIAN